MNDQTPCPKGLSREDKRSIMAAHEVRHTTNIGHFGSLLQGIIDDLGYVPGDEELFKEFKRRYNIDLEKSGFWS